MAKASLNKKYEEVLRKVHLITEEQLQKAAIKADEDDKYLLKVVDSEGSQLFEKELTQKADHIAVYDDQFAFSTSNALSIYNYDGSEVLSTELGSEVQSIKWLDENMIFIKYTNFAEIYEITY